VHVDAEPADALAQVVVDEAAVGELRSRVRDADLQRERPRVERPRDRPERAEAGVGNPPPETASRPTVASSNPSKPPWSSATRSAVLVPLSSAGLPETAAIRR
jgi:hypothetical protein